MKKILQYLFEHKTLSREQAKDALVQISQGAYNEHEVTSFVTVFLMRRITIDELMGFRDALLSLAVKVNLGVDNAIDIVFNNLFDELDKTDEENDGDLVKNLKICLENII